MIGKYTTHSSDSSYSDKAQKWFSQIDRGLERRKEQEKRWEVNESFEDMKQWDDGLGGLTFGEGNQPTINKIGAYNRDYRTNVAFRNPRVKMVPKNAAAWEMIKLPIMGQNGQPKTDPETGEVEVTEMTRAKARETLINDIIGKPLFGLRDMISRVVKSGCLAYGAAAVGYSPMFQTPLEKSTDDSVPVGEDGSLDLSGFVLSPLTGLPMEDDSGNPIKKNRIPTWEEWFIDWVHYRHMIIDPDGGNDFMKHRWVAMEQIRTLEEVKADPLFKHTKDLQATGSLMHDESERSGSGRHRWGGEQDKDDSTDLVRLFHIYDLVRDRRIVLADGHGEVLLDEDMPPGITHSPFAFFRPNERITDIEEFYPRPLDTDLVPLASENNQARKMLAIARDRSKRKIIMEKGALDGPNQDKLTNDVDLEIVESDKVSQYGIDKLVHMVQVPPIGGDLYNNLNIISADFDEIGGVGVASRGGSSGDTATEVQKRSRGEGARLDFDRQQLRDFLIILFKKLDDSIDANMTVARAISISGEAGQLHQVLLDRDMIACDCDVDIELTEMAPTDDEGDAARMIQFAQVMGQNDWMASNEAIVRTMAERVKIRDENFIKGFVQAAQDKIRREQEMQQMQLQAQMQQAQMAAQAKGAGQGKDGKVPEGAPPSDPGQQEMQNAAGMQMPRMQGAQ